jgi:hypothetical protein
MSIKNIAVVKLDNFEKTGSTGGVVIETWFIDSWENTLKRNEWKELCKSNEYKIVECTNQVKVGWIYKDLYNNGIFRLIDSNTQIIDKYFIDIVI